MHHNLPKYPEKIQVRPLLRPLISLNDIHFSQQLTVCFLSLMGSSDIMLVLTKNINHLNFYQDKQTP